MSYRLNYGNGQVSETLSTLALAIQCYDEQIRYSNRIGQSEHNASLWIDKYEAGSADDPGQWERVRELVIERARKKNVNLRNAATF